MKGIELIKELLRVVLDPKVFSIYNFQLNILFLCILCIILDSPRRELENVVKRARKDRDQSQYWINKVLEAEEKDPNRYLKIVLQKPVDLTFYKLYIIIYKLLLII